MSKPNGVKPEPRGEVIEWPLKGRVPRSITRTGKLIGWSETSGPMVDYPGNAGSPLTVRVVGSISREDLDAGIGREAEVLLTFAEDRPGVAFLLGIIQPARPRAMHPRAALRRDGDRLTLEGESEVALTCGKATLVLREDGKITVQGENITSRARRRHRIKGGAVLIN